MNNKNKSMVTNTMIKERFTLTCEIEKLPKESDIVAIELVVLEKGFFTRIFKNYRVVTFKSAVVINTEVVKEKTKTHTCISCAAYEKQAKYPSE